MDQESAMMIYLSYQKLRMPTFSTWWKTKGEKILIYFYKLGVRQRRTENPLRERLLVRKFILQLENYFQQQQELSIITTDHEQMEIDQEADDED